MSVNRKENIHMKKNFFQPTPCYFLKQFTTDIFLPKPIFDRSNLRVQKFEHHILKTATFRNLSFFSSSNSVPILFRKFWLHSYWNFFLRVLNKVFLFEKINSWATKIFDSYNCFAIALKCLIKSKKDGTFSEKKQVYSSENKIDQICQIIFSNRKS